MDARRWQTLTTGNTQLTGERSSDPLPQRQLLGYLFKQKVALCSCPVSPLYMLRVYRHAHIYSLGESEGKKHVGRRETEERVRWAYRKYGAFSISTNFELASRLVLPIVKSYSESHKGQEKQRNTHKSALARELNLICKKWKSSQTCIFPCSTTSNHR